MGRLDFNLFVGRIQLANVTSLYIWVVRGIILFGSHCMYCIVSNHVSELLIDWEIRPLGGILQLKSNEQVYLHRISKKVLDSFDSPVLQ